MSSNLDTKTVVITLQLHLIQEDVISKDPDKTAPLGAMFALDQICMKIWDHYKILIGVLILL